MWPLDIAIATPLPESQEQVKWWRQKQRSCPCPDFLQVPGWKADTWLHSISFPWQPLTTLSTAKCTVRLPRKLEIVISPTFRNSVASKGGDHFCSPRGPHLVHELECTLAIKFRPLGMSAFRRCPPAVC